MKEQEKARKLTVSSSTEYDRRDVYMPEGNGEHLPKHAVSPEGATGEKKEALKVASMNEAMSALIPASPDAATFLIELAKGHRLDKEEEEEHQKAWKNLYEDGNGDTELLSLGMQRRIESLVEPEGTFTEAVEKSLASQSPEELKRRHNDWSACKSIAEKTDFAKEAEASAFIVKLIEDTAEKRHIKLEDVHLGPQKKEEERKITFVKPEKKEHHEKRQSVEDKGRDDLEKKISELKNRLEQVEDDELKTYLEGYVQRLTGLLQGPTEKLEEEYKNLVIKIDFLERHAGDNFAKTERIADESSEFITSLIDELSKRGSNTSKLFQEAKKESQEKAEQFGDTRRARAIGAASGPEEEDPFKEFDPSDFPIGDENDPEPVRKAKDEFHRIVNLAKKSGDDLQALRKLHGDAFHLLKKGESTTQQEEFVRSLSQKIFQLKLSERVTADLQAEQIKRQHELGARDPRSSGELDEPPFKEEDRDLYEGYVHETLEARMSRIFDHPDEYSSDELITYYNELRQKVGVVLRNHEEKRLNLLDWRYDKFKEIKDTDLTATDITAIQDNVQWLQDEEKGRLSRYFKQHEDQHRHGGETIGVPLMETWKEMRPREGYFPLPVSLEDTMGLIRIQYGEQYAPGGEFELIDINGNFHRENFAAWARSRVSYFAEENPASPIDPLNQQIRIRAGYSEIPLFEILYTPQYTLHKPFDIIGDEEKNPESVEGGWGMTREHEKFKRAQAEDLLYEINWFGRGHNERVVYRSNQGDRQKWEETMMQIHGDNYLGRSNNIFRILRRPSRGTGRERGNEFDSFYEHGEQGSLGKSLSDMVLAYSYLPDFTEFHEDKITKEEKPFEENMFYRFMEVDGSTAFLTAVSEGVLNENAKMKDAYGKFIKDRIVAARNEYLARPNIAGDEAKRKKVEQLFESQVEKIGSVEVNFTSSSHIASFHNDVRELVLGENADRIARAERTKEIAIDVKKDLLRNLKEGYFKKIKDVEIDDHDPGDKKTGRDIKLKDAHAGHGKTMGDLFDEFDPAQVMTFDRDLGYAQGNYDPDNPFQNDRQRELFEKNEQLALALVKRVAHTKRKDLNYFNVERSNPITERIIDGAIRKSIAELHGLDEVEGKYAWRWAHNWLWPMGIAASNDTNFIGFDNWTKLIRTEGWRIRQSSKRTYAGNEETFLEIGALSRDWFQLLRVREEGESLPERSLKDIMQGGKGGELTRRLDRKLKSPSEYSINTNAQYNIVKNNLTSANKFLALLISEKDQFHQLIRTDQYGNLVIDHEKAGELVRDWWTSIRYTYGHNDLDFSDKIWADGKETDFLHIIYGEKTRGLLEVIRRQNLEGSSQKDIKESYEEIYKDPAAAAFATIIGADIAVHHRFITSYNRWTIQNIQEIEAFFGELLHETKKVEVKDRFGNPTGEYKIEKGKRLFSYTTFGAMLRAYDMSRGKMERTELAKASLEGAGTGFAQAFAEFMRAIVPQE